MCNLHVRWAAFASLRACHTDIWGALALHGTHVPYQTDEKSLLVKSFCIQKGREREVGICSKVSETLSHFREFVNNNFLMANFDSPQNAKTRLHTFDVISKQS